MTLMESIQLGAEFSFNLLVPGVFSPAMYEWAWSVFLIIFVFLAYNLQIHVTFIYLSQIHVFCIKLQVIDQRI